MSLRDPFGTAFPCTRSQANHPWSDSYALILSANTHGRAFAIYSLVLHPDKIKFSGENSFSYCLLL